MSRSLTRISLAFVLFISSEAWAIGLGDINLDSALNEPLRAEIELLSPTEEELGSLSVTLASSDTFARYGLDRPFYLQDIEFNVVGDADGAVVQVRSRNAITEPFLTFLVEATWSSGRLLREYTVLLDPPTYSPPAVQQTPTVQAPRRATPADSARIERAPQPAQPAQQQPVYSPPPRPEPRPEPVAPTVQPAPSYDGTYSTVVGGDYYVNRGDTLWGIASRLRPDSRLSMNQTMVAIYEANPEAFEGNINRLKAGTTLRIPSADNVFQIARTDAFEEVKRQNDAWRADMPPADTGVADVGYEEPAYEEPVYEEPAYEEPVASEEPAYEEPAYEEPAYEEPAYEEPAYEEPDATADAGQDTETTLELVPPDEEQPGVAFDDDLEAAEPLTREQQIENRIADLEGADVPAQQSLIEIRDAELAALREELAEIRGETFEPEPVGEDAAVAEEAEEPAAETAVRTPRREAPSFFEKLIGWATSTWAMIAYALVVVAGLLFWFVRRGGGDNEPSEWETLEQDEIAAGAMSVASKSTTTMAAPTPDEAIVVVEQDSGIRPVKEDTVEAPMEPEPADLEETGQFDSLEDTFSAETAQNLDQTDPLAEADFHMAYGLYDQAADLVSGALKADPGNQSYMAKLCEIYFVWGNRDAFVDSATNLRDAIGGGESVEWDKIVIMGQQIAADHELFAGAGVAGATKAVDLTFEAEGDDGAVLDVDFGGPEDAGADIVDLGAASASADVSVVDFTFEDEPDAGEALDATAEIQAAVGDATVESPTLEARYGDVEGTSQIPSLDPGAFEASASEDSSSDATAEINLDELDLDVPGLAETEFVDLDGADGDEFIDDLAETGQREMEASDDSATVELGAPGSAALNEAVEEAARMAEEDSAATTDTSKALDLRGPTGQTEVLGAEFGVETDSAVDAEIGADDATMLAPGYGDLDDDIPSDAETLLASLDDDEEGDFDYAQTEALPDDALIGEAGAGETNDTTVAVAGTDVDLDLDDLTAALKQSEIGDPAESMRDESTVEQLSPLSAEDTSEIETMAISPEAMSDDLHEARTMTEVGTKLDLARAYVDMGDPQGARSILEEVLEEGDESQRQQAQQLLDTLPS